MPRNSWPGKRRLPALPLPAEAARTRRASGASQQALAEIVKVTSTTISAWERGLHAPTGSRRKRYAAALRNLAKELSQ